MKFRELLAELIDPALSIAAAVLCLLLAIDAVALAYAG